MHVIVHYAEIGTKGKNRSNFEARLIKNIKAKAKALVQDIKKETGQITIETKDAEKLLPILKCIPGIAHVASAIRTDIDLEKIKEASFTYLKNVEFESFKLTARRQDKNITLRSNEINNVVGEHIRTKLSKKVQMKNPDVNLRIALTNDSAYLYKEVIKGVGGLPTDSSNKVVALLSGGFDSPVAAYLMMKRGVEVILVHAQIQTKGAKIEEKIDLLTEQLAKFQLRTKTYFVPFQDIQQEVVKSIPDRMWMLAQRKVMVEIAAEIAKKEKARWIVLGDSLSQVGSQTPENIEALYTISEIPLISPLIGLDKAEIFEIAREIETFSISELPHADCCTFFQPKHPELRATAEDVEKCSLAFKFIKAAVDTANSVIK